MKIRSFNGNHIGTLRTPHRPNCICALPNGFAVGLVKGGIRIYTD